MQLHVVVTCTPSGRSSDAGVDISNGSGGQARRAPHGECVRAVRACRRSGCDSGSAGGRNTAHLRPLESRYTLHSAPSHPPINRSPLPCSEPNEVDAARAERHPGRLMAEQQPIDERRQTTPLNEPPTTGQAAESPEVTMNTPAERPIAKPRSHRQIDAHRSPCQTLEPPIRTVLARGDYKSAAAAAAGGGVGDYMGWRLPPSKDANALVCMAMPFWRSYDAWNIAA